MQGVKHQKQPNLGLFAPFLANLRQIGRFMTVQFVEF